MVRVTALLALVTLLLWWLAIPLAFPVSSRAVVNARIAQARSPMDGMNVELHGEVGDEVAAGQPLVRVANPVEDTTHLAEVEVRVKALEAGKTRLEQELREGRAALPGLRASVERYQGAALAALRSSVEEAEARVEAATIEAHAAKQRRERVARSKATTDGEAEDLHESHSKALKNLEKDRATLARLKGELAAAKEGIFLNNEASYGKRRADDLAEKIASLESAVRENDAKLASGREQLAVERKRTEALKGTDITSPVAGVVWQRVGNLGQAVKQNEVVYEVADRDTIFVEAVFHQRHLGQAVVPGGAGVRDPHQRRAAVRHRPQRSHPGGERRRGVQRGQAVGGRHPPDVASPSAWTRRIATRP